MPEDTTYAGWRVVSVDASGGALLDGPGGDRRRVWFGESAALVERDILKARVKKLEGVLEAIAESADDPRVRKAARAAVEAAEETPDDA